MVQWTSHAHSECGCHFKFFIRYASETQECGEDTVSLLEVTCLCNIKPTLSTFGRIRHNFQEWCNYLWAVRQSYSDYIWQLSAKEGFYTVSYSMSFFRNIWCNTNLLICCCHLSLDSGAGFFNVCARQKKRGNTESFYYKLTPGMFANQLLNFLKFRQALWSC